MNATGHLDLHKENHSYNYKNVGDNEYSVHIVAAQNGIMHCDIHPGVWITRPGGVCSCRPEVRDCPICFVDTKVKLGRELSQDQRRTFYTDCRESLVSVKNPSKTTASSSAVELTTGYLKMLNTTKRRIVLDKGMLLVYKDPTMTEEEVLSGNYEPLEIFPIFDGKFSITKGIAKIWDIEVGSNCFGVLKPNVSLESDSNIYFDIKNSTAREQWIALIRDSISRNDAKISFGSLSPIFRTRVFLVIDKGVLSCYEEETFKLSNVGKGLIYQKNLKGYSLSKSIDGKQIHFTKEDGKDKLTFMTPLNKDSADSWFAAFEQHVKFANS